MMFSIKSSVYDSSWVRLCMLRDYPHCNFTFGSACLPYFHQGHNLLPFLSSMNLPFCSSPLNPFPKSTFYPSLANPYFPLLIMKNRRTFLHLSTPRSMARSTIVVNAYADTPPSFSLRQLMRDENLNCSSFLFDALNLFGSVVICG